MSVKMASTQSNFPKILLPNPDPAKLSQFRGKSCKPKQTVHNIAMETFRGSRHAPLCSTAQFSHGGKNAQKAKNSAELLPRPDQTFAVPMQTLNSIAIHRVRVTGRWSAV